MSIEKYTSIPLWGFDIILAIIMLFFISLKYYDPNIPLIFIIPALPLLAVFIGTIIFLKINIQQMKFQAVIPFLIVLSGILILVFVPFLNIKLFLNYHYFLNDRKEVVELIKNSELAAGDNGYLVLPEQYKNTSKGGAIRIEKEDNFKIIFYFSHSDFWNSTDIGYVYIANDIELIGRHFDEIVDKCDKITDNWYYCALFDNT